ncbi:unnamed protein product [Fusarium graminearum]|nr:hypothetical protein FG05_13316 [Fusarium graminearum]CZS80389.1 unnamed protein product [Fusarium graminearum]
MCPSKSNNSCSSCSVWSPGLLVLDVFVFPAPDILSKELQEYYLPSGKTLSQLHSLSVVSFVTREHACGAEWPTAFDIEICILDKAEAFSSEAMPTREVNRIFPRSVEWSALPDGPSCGPLSPQQARTLPTTLLRLCVKIALETPVKVEMPSQKGKSTLNVLAQAVTVVVPTLRLNRTHWVTVEKPKRGTTRYKLCCMSSLTSHPACLYCHRPEFFCLARRLAGANLVEMTDGESKFVDQARSKRKNPADNSGLQTAPFDH